MKRYRLKPGVSNTHGAASVTEQSSPFNVILEVQQKSPDNPMMSPHPEPPHSPQRESQQTVPPLFSMPTRPLLQVVFDIASARVQHQGKTRGIHAKE